MRVEWRCVVALSERAAAEIPASAYSKGVDIVTLKLVPVQCQGNGNRRCPGLKLSVNAERGRIKVVAGTTKIETPEAYNAADPEVVAGPLPGPQSGRAQEPGGGDRAGRDRGDARPQLALATQKATTSSMAFFGGQSRKIASASRATWP